MRSAHGKTTSFSIAMAELTVLGTDGDNSWKNEIMDKVPLPEFMMRAINKKMAESDKFMSRFEKLYTNGYDTSYRDRATGDRITLAATPVPGAVSFYIGNRHRGWRMTYRKTKKGFPSLKVYEPTTQITYYNRPFPGIKWKSELRTIIGHGFTNELIEFWSKTIKVDGVKLWARKGTTPRGIHVDFNKIVHDWFDMSNPLETATICVRGTENHGTSLLVNGSLVLLNGDVVKLWGRRVPVSKVPTAEEVIAALEE